MIYPKDTINTAYKIKTINYKYLKANKIKTNTTVLNPNIHYYRF